MGLVHAWSCSSCPWLDRSPVKSIRYKGWMFKTALTLFVLSFRDPRLSGHAQESGSREWTCSSFQNVTWAQICMIIYFAFFFLMPCVHQAGTRPSRCLTRVTMQMKKRITACHGPCCCRYPEPGSAASRRVQGASGHRAHIDLGDKASAAAGRPRSSSTSGLSCHSAARSCATTGMGRGPRYQRRFGQAENLDVRLGDKVGDPDDRPPCRRTMPGSWFGTAPPDLSLVISDRARKPDWIYTYLRSFYLDEELPHAAGTTRCSPMSPCPTRCTSGRAPSGRCSTTRTENVAGEQMEITELRPFREDHAGQSRARNRVSTPPCVISPTFMVYLG